VTTRTRLPRAERERQALAVARSLFAERGYAAVTMDDVAAAVGVTKPLLYAYFGNKEGLYLACMEPASEALRATVLAAVEGAADGAEALDRGVHAFFAFVDDDRDAWRVLFDETLPSGAIALRVAGERALLAEQVAAALLRRLPADARGARAVRVEALSAALLGAAEALARWWLRTGAMTADEAAGLLVATVEPGLRDAAR
jgi:AcrR family transcriptional regulator